MDELIAVLHDTIASGLELDFIAGVHRFDMVVEKLLENHEIPYFSMCSGTGLDSRCHDALASFWSAQYGTKFRWRELGVCEHNEKKQRWLRSQHAHIEVLVSELEEMQENVVKNIKDEKRAVYQAFPYCWDGGAGWPCTSLTSLNCHASTNVGSVQEESSESGRAFAMVHKAVETHGPEIFCMENVMNVLKDTPSGISDAEWVKRKFISIGYWCVYFVVANREHGGLPDRWRVWWVCARNLRGDVSAIDRFFLSVLASLKIPGELTSRDRYVILDDDERQEASQALGFEILKGSGPRRLKNTEKDEPGWKDSCLDLYEVFGLVWPPVYTDPRYKHICVEGLLPREAATTLLYDIVWPMQAPLEFIDINPKLERVITSPKNFEEIAEKDLWSVDSSEVHLVGRGVAKQSPWRAFPGTIVGGSTLIVRSLKPRRTRALDAIEYMALMGWCREVWAKDVDRPDLGLGTQALQLAVVVSSHCVSVLKKYIHIDLAFGIIYTYRFHVLSAGVHGALQQPGGQRMVGVPLYPSEDGLGCDRGHVLCLGRRRRQRRRGSRKRGRREGRQQFERRSLIGRAVA